MREDEHTTDRRDRPRDLLGVRARVRAALAIYEGVFVAPYRAAVQREHLRQHDLFLLATFSDALGVPNPVEFYTLELLPDLFEEYHRWHQRAGLERAPDGAFRCC